jgi:EmrB/QacA subfamily drug resistance transporter
MSPAPEAVRKAEEHPAMPSPHANRATLLTIMIPQAMVVLNMSLILVALPAIREELNVQPELVAWVMTGYTLPFVTSMPFYGRLGDKLGKRRLFIIGITIFLIGTACSYLAEDIYQLILGRAIQGIGAGGFVPLAMAMITQIFPHRQQGQILAAWNSSGPLMSIAGPVLGGFLVQTYQWQIIFLPVLVTATIVPFIMRKRLPAFQAAAVHTTEKSFDWSGGLLLAGSFASLLLFVSSESISGVPNLQDRRFLVLALLLLVIFILWERSRVNPLVDFKLFLHRSFAVASFSAGVRTIAMSGVGFILPLYLADVFRLKPSAIGILLMINSTALLVSMQIGGRLSDRLGSWIPVTVGFLGQALTLGGLAMALPSAKMTAVIMAIAINGLAAGLTLPPLHRAALRHIPDGEISSAAGLYSMLRFSGAIFGPPVAALLLSLRPKGSVLQAYSTVFWFVCAMALVGLTMMLALRLSTRRKARAR